MSLTSQQIEQVAQLARLQLAPEQVQHYTEQLTAIFELVGQLSQAQTQDVEPMAHPLEMVQRLRPDVVSEDNLRERFQAIAPEVSGGLYLVPKVIE